MSTDAELLRRYIQERSETAFTELVQRHLNLVYFAALRQVGGDAHRARDVAQTVFTDLARKARALTDRATLSGWLHTSTRFAAAKLRRADTSRKHYEQEAMIMSTLLPESDLTAEWERLRPLIDDAIQELNARDREAVLLRFFEGRPFAEIGTILSVSEDAARMRVERALDKLRALLGRRGVTSTSAALATVFGQQLSAAVPAGLAHAIAGAALAGATGGIASLGAGIFMSKTTTTAVTAVALVAIGSLLFQWHRVQRAEDDLATVSVERDRLRAQLRTEQENSARAARELTGLRMDVEALQAQKAPAPVAAKKEPVAERATTSVTLGLAKWEIQQQTLNNLRQIDAARKQARLEHGAPAGSIHDLVGRGKFIKAVRTVDGEDYSKLSMNPAEPLTVTTPNGIAVTFDPTGVNTTRPDFPPEVARVNELGERVGPLANQALRAYRTANDGKAPPNEQALIPYFASPKEGADFVEFLEAKKAAGM